MSDGELPDTFTVRSESILHAVETEVYCLNGQWHGEARVIGPLGLSKMFTPEEMSRNHAERLYREYTVVDE